MATNELIDRVGLEAVNRAMERRGLRATRLHKKLYWDIPGDLGTTTPREIATLMESIHARRCVSRRADEAMVAILERQHYNSALTRLLPYSLVSEEGGRPPAVRVASKSGSLDGVRNDAGIVRTPWGDYVVALMTDGALDPRYHADNEAMLLLPRVSRAILEAFREEGA